MRLWVTALFFVAVVPAIAAPYRGVPSCSAIVGAMDSDDQRQKGYALQSLTDTMMQLDEEAVRRKRRGIMLPLSEDGLVGVLAMVIVQCRKNEAQSSRSAATYVSDGLREMGAAMGLK